MEKELNYVDYGGAAISMHPKKFCIVVVYRGQVGNGLCRLDKCLHSPFKLKVIGLDMKSAQIFLVILLELWF